jgi:hypothetical protein
MTTLQRFAETKAIVQLVLPPAWVARLNALAIARGLTRSALIREAIAATLLADPADGGPRPEHPAASR